ncbi:unnamed protein product [Paramecium primaurelia]|uniref:Uncharacterized protein n=1 Tax=Paramecium primaurelia TaxID=5886 RepID=A0A8S1QPC8_PARPR|nr:unnamed protein product [Paramecium primaurelia]
MKVGKWTELCFCFEENLQVIYQGNYQNGIKFGLWKLIHISSHITQIMYSFYSQLILVVEGNMINLDINKDFGENCIQDFKTIIV